MWPGASPAAAGGRFTSACPRAKSAAVVNRGRGLRWGQRGAPHASRPGPRPSHPSHGCAPLPPARRLPPGGGRPLLPAGGGGGVVVIIIIIFSPTRNIQSRLIHFCPFASFASRLGSRPAAAPHAPSRRARSPPPRAGAPRCSGAGSRRRPSLPAGSPLPRAGKCRKSSPSPPALSPGLDRSRRSPATGCKTHQPFRGCAGDRITIIML